MFPVAAIGALIGVAGTALSFYGQYQSAKQLQKLAQNRIKAAEAEAMNVTQQSHENTIRSRKDAETYLSQVRAGVSGMSGLVNTDSLLQSQGEAASVLELQIQDAARSEKMRAHNIMAQARTDAWELTQRAQAQRMSAFTGAIEGGSRIFGSLDMKATGRFIAKPWNLLNDIITPDTSKNVINQEALK